MFKKIAVLGVGLIGGSFALSLRRNLGIEIFGLDISQSSLKKAIEIGAIDAGSTHISDLASFNPECVIISTPLSAAIEIAPVVLNSISENAIVSDVCSVKGEFVSSMERIFGKRFVGAHPIAGTERSGISNADRNLFLNKLVILTPTENTDPMALRAIQKLWESLGARAEVMDPYLHDFIFGTLSHLPHAVCFALTSCAMSLLKDRELFRYSGSGFLDSTRIAASDPIMWRDIFFYNRDNLIKGLDLLISTLSSFKDLIKNDAHTELLKFLQESSSIRRSLYDHRDR
ncbi:MAG: prephenate dehydrogenase/arogenate dehydrogenase family protein [Aquificaceae bacterium]